MDNLNGKLGYGDNIDPRFRLSAEELDVTKDMVLTGEITQSKEISEVNLGEPPME
jgi:stress response protein YsnF